MSELSFSVPADERKQVTADVDSLVHRKRFSGLVQTLRATCTADINPHAGTVCNLTLRSHFTSVWLSDR